MCQVNSYKANYRHIIILIIINIRLRGISSQKTEVPKTRYSEKLSSTFPSSRSNITTYGQSASYSYKPPLMLFYLLFFFFFQNKVSTPESSIYVNCHFLGFLTTWCSAVRGRDIACSVLMGNFSSGGLCVYIHSIDITLPSVHYCMYINPFHVTHKQTGFKERSHVTHTFHYAMKLIIHISTAKPITSWYLNKGWRKLYMPINWKNLFQ
jgi:hypothetical protein